MREINADAVVIGGGAAGMTAASVLAKRGKDTVVVTKGLGSTYLSSGCIDLLGYSPDGSYVSNPVEGIMSLAGSKQAHPYSMISDGKSDGAVRIVRDAMAHFVSESKKQNIKIDGKLSENVLLASSLGTLKPTCFAQDSMYCGKIPSVKKAVIAGIAGFADFNPVFVAESVMSVAKTFGFDCSLKSAYMKFGRTQKNGNFEWRELRHMMKNRNKRESFIRELKTISKKHKVGTVGIPPIFELGACRDLFSADVQVFEIPMPFLGGSRLHALFSGIAKSCGAKIMDGYEVTEVCTKSKKCIGVTAESNLRKIKFEADAFIISTGDILTGLAEKNGKIKEPLFGLTAGDKKTYGKIKSQVFPKGGHPAFGIGVNVNPSLLPVDESGREILSNVHVAGSLLGGYDYTAEKSGLGVAIATGYAAGVIA